MKIQKVELTAKVLKQLDYLDRMIFPADEPYPKEGRHWWFAKDKEGPFGFAGLEKIGDHTGFVCRIGVFQRYSGQGIGRKLLQVAEAYAKKLGCNTVVSHTLPDNYRSANNLIRRGYQIIKPLAWFHYKGALHFRKAI